MVDIKSALRYSGNVCISGLTASGKTTHSHMLAGEFGLTYISGSQIQLNFMGVSPIQSREFWITPEAKAYWDADQFRRIDAELLNLEETRNGCIFDTSTMPWRHKREALSIWLESSLESRVIKSIVSHHGNGETHIDDYPNLIKEKDRATVDLYNELYNISIGVDLAPFDIIIDISSLATEPTLACSLDSISIAHSIVRPASAYYLTGRRTFLDEYMSAKMKHLPIVIRDGLLEARLRNEHS